MPFPTEGKDIHHRGHKEHRENHRGKNPCHLPPVTCNLLPPSSPIKRSLPPPPSSANRHSSVACAASCPNIARRGVSNEVASENTATPSGNGRSARSASSAWRNDTPASRSRTSSSK